MAATVRTRLAIAAARLAKSNPEDWKTFFIQIAAFAEESRDNCVMSPIDALQVNQGKAQALTALVEDLHKCIETADRAIQKQEQNR